jgi:2-C-methyl-D-erythritol 2,4-cyclodiphosphate synthase
VVQLLQERALRIGNVDITIVAQAPRLAAHIPAMMANIAADCRIDLGRSNVKATTTEQLGFTGRGEGIAVYAVALLQEAGD